MLREGGGGLYYDHGSIHVAEVYTFLLCQCFVNVHAVHAAVVSYPLIMCTQCANKRYTHTMHMLRSFRRCIHIGSDSDRVRQHRNAGWRNNSVRPRQHHTRSVPHILLTKQTVDVCRQQPQSIFFIFPCGCFIFQLTAVASRHTRGPIDNISCGAPVWPVTE